MIFSRTALVAATIVVASIGLGTRSTAAHHVRHHHQGVSASKATRTHVAWSSHAQRGAHSGRLHGRQSPEVPSLVRISHVHKQTLAGAADLDERRGHRHAALCETVTEHHESVVHCRGGND
jgi:hypothetical protein